MNENFTDSFVLDTKTSLTNHEMRIGTLEETVKDIKALTQATHELAFTQKAMNEKIDDLSETVKSIVEQPKKNWVTLRTAIISSVGGAIGTGIIAWLITFLK